MNNNGLFHARRQVFLLLTLLSLLSLVVFWNFIALDDLYLFKDIGADTLNVYLPKYIHLANYLREEGWPAWSFSQGMGQNIFPNSIGDPFELLLFLIGPENLAFGLVYVQIFKILLAGTFFYLYLKLLALEPVTAITGALLYAFSGFMILGGTWYVFSTDALYFAFLLYAFERYLKEHIWIYVPIAVALIAAGITFNIYLYAMFFLPYSLLRHYVCNGWKPRELLRFLWQLSGLALLGIGISAVFLVANLQEMINSPRVLGDASFIESLSSKSPLGFEGFAHNMTAVIRLFSNDLLGTGNEFRGWGNYLEAPILYCGLLSLLLAPQVFVQLERKQKLAFGLFGLVFLIPVILPFFRYLFWAFAGDYYRLFSAFVAFVFLFFGLHALNFILKTGKVNVRLLAATLAVLLIILFLPYFLVGGAMVDAYDSTLCLVTVCLFLVYASLLFTLRSEKFRPLVQWGLLFTICVELAVFSWQTVNDRDVLTVKEYQSKTGYNDYSNDAIAWIKQTETGFYRIEKTYSSGPTMSQSINDAKVQGYFGTTSYHSFNQLNYIRFLDALEVIDGKNEPATRWAVGIVNHHLLASFSSIRYVLAKQPQKAQRFQQVGYRLINKVGDVFVLINPNYLPFGFTYDSYLTKDEFMSLPTLEKSIALMKTAVVEASFDQANTQQIAHSNKTLIKSGYSMESYLNDVQQRRESVLNIGHFNNNQIEGQIELDKPKVLFFTLPYDPGWSVTVDAQPAELLQINIGFSGLLLPAGKHTIELRYQLPYFKASLTVSVLSFICLIILLVFNRVSFFRSTSLEH